MIIEQKNDNGKVTLVIEGWLDHDSASQLGDVIETIDAANELILDLEKVEYVSSAGIRMIVLAHRKAKEVNAEFSVINVNSEVMTILSMTGLDKKLAITGR